MAREQAATTSKPEGRGDKSASKGTRGAPAWSFARSWRAARDKIRTAAGVDVDEELSRVTDPVAKARRLAELAAPADMRLSVALGLGSSPEVLERSKAGTRLLADLAHKRLSIVGLKGQDGVELDVSERMRDFLGAWFGPRTPEEGAGADTTATRRE